ncbi:hypothetical protein PFISCL1PPCAC_10838, partial [Pristionchus fissidentatus]
QYEEFHLGALESRMKETLGFLPLVNTCDLDYEYINMVQKFFSRGIESPGPFFPLFGRFESGMCISERIDTVHTVLEEGREYWFLVCSVTYNEARLQIVDEVFTNPPERTPQAMRLIVNTILKGREPAGWKRHFECLKNMLYVGDMVCTDRFPRNLCPIAVVKARFIRNNPSNFENVDLFPRFNYEQTTRKSMLDIKLIKLTRGRSISPMSIKDVIVWSPYLRRIDESKRRIVFCFNEFMSVAEAFHNLVEQGKLDIGMLLTVGNVRMPTGVLMGFPEEGEYAGKTSFLNYYCIQMPLHRTEEMKQLFNVLRSETIILCGETPLPSPLHCVDLAIPPGDQANRLGLPQIPLDHMHVIQALGYPLIPKEPINRILAPILTREEMMEEKMKMMALIEPAIEWMRKRDTSKKRRVFEVPSSRGAPVTVRSTKTLAQPPKVSKAVKHDDVICLSSDEEDVKPSRLLLDTPASPSLYSSVSSAPSASPVVIAPRLVDRSVGRLKDPRVKSSQPAHEVVSDSRSESVETIGRPSKERKLSWMESRQPTPQPVNSSRSSCSSSQGLQQPAAPPSSAQQSLSQNASSCSFTGLYRPPPLPTPVPPFLYPTSFPFPPLPSSFPDLLMPPPAPWHYPSRPPPTPCPLPPLQTTPPRQREDHDSDMEISDGEGEVQSKEKIEKIKSGEEMMRDLSEPYRMKKEEEDNGVKKEEEEEEMEEIRREERSKSQPIVESTEYVNQSNGMRRHSTSYDPVESMHNSIEEEMERMERDDKSAESPSPVKIPNFRSNRKSAAKHALTARATALPAEEGEVPSDTEYESLKISLWNRKKEGEKRESVSRMDSSAVVIIVDNELFKQIKRELWTSLLSMANERANEAKKRINIVIHEEFDPDSHSSSSLVGRQMHTLQPSLLYVMDHKGEKMSDDIVDCCTSIRKMTGNEKAGMIYLTPNIDAHDVRNQKLSRIGFKVLNGSGTKDHIESLDYESQENNGYDY